MSYVDNREKEIIKKKQFPHEDDSFLFLTLCKFGEEYVTWEYNEETDGFHHGKYWKTLERAEEDFNERWQSLA